MPRPGPRFLRRPVWGPAFANPIRSRNEDFRRILSAKDMPDREFALSFAMRRTFSTEEGPEIHIPGAKLLRKSRAPGGALQKPGTRNRELAGES